MYITSEGIHGVRFPTFDSIASGYVVYGSIKTILHPDFSVFHRTKYNLTPMDLAPVQVVVPNRVTPVDKDHPYVYDVRQAVAKPKPNNPSDSVEDKLDLLAPDLAQAVRYYRATGQLPPESLSSGSEADEHGNEFMEGHIAQLAAGDFTVSVLEPDPGMEVHRHRFLFNASDPAKSTLELVSSQKALVRDYMKRPSVSFFANYYEHCDGQTVTLWREGLWSLGEDDERYYYTGALNLSMSNIPTELGPTGKAPSSDRGELSLVPLIDPQADSLLDGRMIVDCLMDPASGKAAILWRDNLGIGSVDLMEIE